VTEPTAPMQYPWEQPSGDQTQPRGPRRRRRRRGTKWLIALVILLGLLVGADRIALVVAQNMLASKIQSSQHLSQKPAVSIDGFPFLTQVAARDFPHATLDIHGLDANGLTISDLHADLRGVHVDSGFNAATVDNLTATADIDYTDIASALASQFSVAGYQVGTVQISQGGPGQLKASYQLLGISVSADIDVALAGPNTIEFKSAGVTTPIPGLSGNTPGIDQKFVLNDLPFGLNLTQLAFTPSAVQISAQASNLNLNQSSLSTGG
jgi:hypothetical protein